MRRTAAANFRAISAQATIAADWKSVRRLAVALVLLAGSSCSDSEASSLRYPTEPKGDMVCSPSPARGGSQVEVSFTKPTHRSVAYVLFVGLPGGDDQTRCVGWFATHILFSNRAGRAPSAQRIQHSCTSGSKFGDAEDVPVPLDEVVTPKNVVADAGPDTLTLPAKLIPAQVSGLSTRVVYRLCARDQKNVPTPCINLPIEQS